MTKKVSVARESEFFCTVNPRSNEPQSSGYRMEQTPKIHVKYLIFHPCTHAK